MENGFKSSRYNHYITHNNKLYVYNILSTAIIEADKELNSQLINNNIDTINSDYIGDLRDNHFIVHTNCTSEHEEYIYYYESSRFSKARKSIVLTLIPTYACNLACPYCLQGQDKDASFISNENLLRVVKFLSNMLDGNGSKDNSIESLIVRFYGGEPFLHKNIIREFCRMTTEVANIHNIRIKFDMPTNFTIFDNHILDTIKMYDISIQVSIDGTRELHNQRRIDKKGGGTYDIILANLKKACDKGLKDNITLRLNIDQDNISYAEQCLIDTCSYAGHVYFGLLSPYQGYNDAFSSSCISCSDYSDIMAFTLNPLIINHGHVFPMMFGKQKPCTINSENKFYVDDKLNVYKCELVVNNEDFCVGKINSEGELICNSNYYHQMNFTPSNFNECISCKLLPMCGAGCPAKKYLATNGQNGKLDTPNCQYSESDLNKYIKAYIDNSF